MLIAERTTLNCRGTLLDLQTPIVMGILNVAPDSFSDGGRYQSIDAAESQAGQMLAEGASIIDIGGVSTRPGAARISPEEELARVMPHIENLTRVFPHAILSIDTYHSAVAQAAVEGGAHIINDISAWSMDPDMLQVAQDMHVPYVLMHMQGVPSTMQHKPQYENVTLEVIDFLLEKIRLLTDRGIHDIIVDPGFGFGKSIDHNFELLRTLHTLTMLERPILVGLSRKNMIRKALNVSVEESENGTTVLHTLALNQGAKILRCHQVKEAIECIQLWSRTHPAGHQSSRENMQDSTPAD